eukprot:gnl/TRDRNA2_/TRDRNA2_176672_c0_seq1.p1 gnl/TRDRNA2_/TRDRNA2_176672_c0~~gnl/TRDRNA2_/TRDRNA2_176672_c0_seq1.p1  ORF type:complete len:458 (-),score=71.86 gnl/TRDRNA2_/TRDRNA2_176672_c0_seq1:73-1380(-)
MMGDTPTPTLENELKYRGKAAHCGIDDGPPAKRRRSEDVAAKEFNPLDLFDPVDFANKLKAARDATKPTDDEEAAHLASIEHITTALAVIGVLFAVRGCYSLIAMLALGYYKYAKFAILAHHSLHGGWGRSRRRWYAMGLYRRVIDWLDWIFPAAWVAEHNKEHHYKLNEDADPDFVERNTETLQNMPIPMWAKYLVVGFLASTWKWYYYSSNTLKLLHASKPNTPPKEEFEQPLAIAGLVIAISTGHPWYISLAKDFIFRVMSLPFLLNFIALPVAAGLYQGTGFCWYTFANMVGAEIVTNVHAFATIVTNHAGSDLWHFTGACQADSPEFILRAILGSTAYHAGNDIIDYFHGYLNYQGEHHSFPELSPLHYQRLHPHFKKICKSFGVPYIQEPFWCRLKKTADVMVGIAKHKRLVGKACDQPQLWNLKVVSK